MDLSIWLFWEFLFELMTDRMTESHHRYKRGKNAVSVPVMERWTSSIPSTEYRMAHGSLPNQSKCVLLIWKRQLNFSWILWGMLQMIAQSLCTQSRCMVRIASSKSDLSPMPVWVLHGPLSLVVLINFKDRVSTSSKERWKQVLSTLSFLQ